MTIATLGLGTLTGCGNGGPGKPALTAAKNVYVIENAQTNSVETDSVLVFPAGSQGETAPSSTLSLPSGFSASSLAVGPTGEIYVGVTPTSGSAEIEVFAAGATGAAVPLRTITEQRRAALRAFIRLRRMPRAM